MAKRSGGSGPGILKSEPPKSPWGSGGGGSGGKGSGGDGDGGSGSGPRNPWSFPPSGKRPSGGGPLDDLLRRARRGGGPGIPGVPNGRGLWLMIVGGLLTLWVVFTSFHSISPHQQGVVTFLGRYSSTMDPGIGVTLPEPLMSVQKVNVSEIRYEVFPQGNGENLMLTGDQNIVDLKYQVRWNVTNAQDFTFQIADPTETVRATAESAMRAVVSNTTLNDTIGAGRNLVAFKVRDLMQQVLDSYRSGVHVEGVEIKEARAPAKVAADFNAVTAAIQGAQATINNANAYAQTVVAGAQGEAAKFDKLYDQYKLAPEVTRRRLYYETMEKVLAKSNKTIVEAPGVMPYLPIAPAGRKLTEPSAPAQGGGQ